jgi:hypothetical protein
MDAGDVSFPSWASEDRERKAAMEDELTVMPTSAVTAAFEPSVVEMALTIASTYGFRRGPSTRPSDPITSKAMLRSSGSLRESKCLMMRFSDELTNSCVSDRASKGTATIAVRRTSADLWFRAAMMADETDD